MAAECPFCGYRSNAYAVQMHIDELHEFDSPLHARKPTPRARERPLSPIYARQPTREIPVVRRERGEKFRLPAPAPAPKRYLADPPDDHLVREKRIVTKRYPIEEPPWIQCGRQGCGMYVARDVMNQHLDMHDMYDYNAMRRRSDGQGPFDPDDDDDGAPSGFSRQDSLLDAAGRPKSKAASLFTIDTNGTGVRPKNRDELNAMGSNGLRQNRSTGSNKGGAGKGGGGGDGGSSASKSQRKGWSRSSASSKNKGKEAQRSSGDGGKSGKSASGSKSGSGKSNSGRSQKGGGSGNPNDPSGNGPAGGMLNSVANNGQNGGGAPNGSSGNGQNGRRPGSNSGNSQRNGGAGSPNDIRRRDAEDTSGLELQLAKLLLANRNGSGSGGSDPMGPSAGSLLDLHGMPANPPKGPGSAFSLSGVSTSELLQAIQKKTSGNGQRNAMPSNKGAMGNPAGGFNPSSRIPSEAAGLLAAIVASRVR